MKQIFLSLFLFLSNEQINGLIPINKKTIMNTHKLLSEDTEIPVDNIEKEDITTLFKKINNGDINEIIFTEKMNKVLATEKNNYNKYYETDINDYISKKIIDTSISKNTKITFGKIEETNIEKIQHIFSDYGIYILQFAISTLLFKMIYSKMSPLNILSNSNIKQNIQSNMTLESWAGSVEVRNECTEIISYLKNNKEYVNIGAKIPKGILLEGPPGTGKTLLAKVIASECNCNFISVSGSELVELYVGMGAVKIRNIFNEARKKTPSIIFIDEIDSIGKKRGISFGNEEREQTLNQLLTEMDGFNNNENILILAATNLKSTLDSALLRPGRFDRIVNIPLPDKSSREKILKLYIDKVKHQNINITNIGILTGGFSGADLQNLVNEAAIYAVRENRNYITDNDIVVSLEKLTIGIVKKNDTRSLDTLERIAVHEVGHALLGLIYKDIFNIQKISIQSTYSGYGGFTLSSLKDDINENGLYTKDILKKRIIMLLGGKAAESIYYGREFVSLGATQDLKEANLLARKMITNYGMGNKLEVFYDSDKISYDDQNKYSNFIKNKIDEESLNIVIDSYNQAVKILEDNKNIFNDLIKKLLEKTIIDQNDLLEISNMIT
jgi:cell division protease FtsH